MIVWLFHVGLNVSGAEELQPRKENPGFSVALNLLSNKSADTFQTRCSGSSKSVPPLLGLETRSILTRSGGIAEKTAETDKLASIKRFSGLSVLLKDPPLDESKGR